MGKAGVSYNIPLARVGRTATLIPLVRVDRAPLPTDTRYDVMTIWQDIPTTEIYYLASFNNGLANWQKFKTPGTGTFEFLTVTDTATINTLDVSGDATFLQTLTAHTGEFEFLTVTDTATIFTLNVAGDATFLQTLTAHTGEFANLVVNQSTYINNSIQFKGVSPGWTNSEYTTFQGAMTTTDDTPASVFTLMLGENQAMSVHAQITGMKDDFSEACGGTLVYTARREVGSAVEVGLPVTSIQTESTATFSADVDGDTLRVLVTGVTAETWNWIATIQLQPLESSA